jgi:hypothetical protein
MKCLLLLGVDHPANVGTCLGYYMVYTRKAIFPQVFRVFVFAIRGSPSAPWAKSRKSNHIRKPFSNTLSHQFVQIWEF